ncbi:MULTISPECIES: hypothetical protein [unclassified Clostridium]|uniref:hypothetical protein n=1 Tax=unclassified Clostridium TaxID=2614128 RepID=UPI00207A6862|nr:MULTISPECIES: hypothetical protein [unclassified Clostridium]
MKAVKKIKKYVIKEYNKKEQEETGYNFGIFLIEDDYEPQMEADNIQELIDWVD